jgi:hypothetical protein
MPRSADYSWFRTIPFPHLPLRENAIFLSVPILFTIGLLLLLRRIAGAFDTPLPPILLLTTAALLTVWLSVISDHWLEQPRDSADRSIVWSQTAVAAAWSTLALFAIACSFPFERLLDWLIWPAAFTAAWFGPQALQSLRRHLPQLAALLPTPLTKSPTPDKPNSLPVQTLTRYRTADGTETIRAQLRAEFPPNERMTTLHVAFCPPFEKLPTVEAYLTDDITADVNLTQVLHHGAQIEIRLPTPAGKPLAANVELIASETTE